MATHRPCPIHPQNLVLRYSKNLSGWKVGKRENCIKDFLNSVHSNILQTKRIKLTTAWIRWANYALRLLFLHVATPITFNRLSFMDTTKVRPWFTKRIGLLDSDSYSLNTFVGNAVFQRAWTSVNVELVITTTSIHTKNLYIRYLEPG
jgi:hypothetical protein